MPLVDEVVAAVSAEGWLLVLFVESPPSCLPPSDTMYGDVVAEVPPRIPPPFYNLDICNFWKLAFISYS